MRLISYLHFNVGIQNLSAGLQFPRNWLVPVNTGQEPSLDLDAELPEPYVSVLSYNIGALSYSTRSGFKFDQIDNFDFNRSAIGKTGLIIKLDELQVDLSSDRN